MKPLILQFLSQHSAACEGTALVLLVAFGKCMPAQIPRSVQDVWSWIYQTVQTALPVPHSLPEVKPAASTFPDQPKK